MAEDSLKETILRTAVALFSSWGYHGTSIRDIARFAQCSLPMLYYYFKNKSDLYEEIIGSEFIKIYKKLNKKMPDSLPVQDNYYYYLIQLKKLPAYEKAVYKIALRAWWGFEGDDKTRKMLADWDKERVDLHRRILTKHYPEAVNLDVFISIVSRVVQNIVDRMILTGENIPDKNIEAEMSLLFKLTGKYSLTG